MERLSETPSGLAEGKRRAATRRQPKGLSGQGSLFSNGDLSRPADEGRQTQRPHAQVMHLTFGEDRDCALVIGGGGILVEPSMQRRVHREQRQEEEEQGTENPQQNLTR
jgi:hypothetical protein